jgi:hypothetical protein
MVIYNFHVFRSQIGPSEAYAPLVIHADAVLSRTPGSEQFESVSRGRSQIVK